MLNAGCLRFTASGRVACTGLGVPVFFSGGVPVDITGAVCFSPSTQDLYLAGIGYRTSTRICGDLGPLSGFEGPFARSANGGLALAALEPITNYYAGIPLVADGRVAVEFETPIVPSAFSFAFDDDAFA